MLSSLVVLSLSLSLSLKSEESTNQMKVGKHKLENTSLIALIEVTYYLGKEEWRYPLLCFSLSLPIKFDVRVDPAFFFFSHPTTPWFGLITTLDTIAIWWSNISVTRWFIEVAFLKKGVVVFYKYIYIYTNVRS